MNSSHTEIERKFLVKGDFSGDVTSSVRIIQGYLCSVPERTVRVRVKGTRGYLTVKGRGSESGASRFEWEKEISLDDALHLLSLAEPGVISKVRHLVPSEDGVHTWEVDEFHGENEGLVMAEIELSSEADSFPRPSWIGEEVTGDPRYYNSSLSTNPFRTWK